MPIDIKFAWKLFVKFKRFSFFHDIYISNLQFELMKLISMKFMNNYSFVNNNKLGGISDVRWLSHSWRRTDSWKIEFVSSA